MAYQLITLRGFDEPWWFFDNWQKDITNTLEFSDLKEALVAYQSQYQHYQSQFSQVKTRHNTLTAFWQSGDYEYCTPCESNQQIYYSLMLVKNYEILDEKEEQFVEINI